MHELSIAQSIIEIVEQHVKLEDLPLVREVKVKIGEMAGVVPDSLEFCFTAIIVDTALQNSTMSIEFVPYVVRCNGCHEDFRSAYGIVQCPKCEGSETTVLSGTELYVAEIEMAEPLETV